MTPDIWKVAGLVIAAFASVAGILGALYGIVTKPMLRTVKAEISASQSQLEARIIASQSQLEARIIASQSQLEARIIASQSQFETRIIELEKNLKVEMAGLRVEMAGLRVEMAAMEKRLNERIDTRLVHQ